MADAPANQPDPSASGQPSVPGGPSPVVVKKYANRRLYNTETSSYITLDNLAEMIRAGRDFAVYDAKSGEDITRGVLTQIIVEEESKGSALLPTAFLRQLIGFYGDSLQGVVPRYLETAMSSFARQQQQFRQVVQQTFSPFLPAGVEEMSRQNLALIERTVALFNPFHRAPEAPSAAAAPPVPAAPADSADDAAELERLRGEVEHLRAELAAARAAAAHAAEAAAAAHALPPTTEEAMQHAVEAAAERAEPPPAQEEAKARPDPVPAAALRTPRRTRTARSKD